MAHSITTRNGQFEYLAVGETAQDTFDYTVTDSNGATDTATVTITITGVNDANTANADAYGTDEDTVLNVLLGAGLVQNDTDIDTNDTLTVDSVDDSSTTGNVTWSADGSFDYDPDGQFEYLAVGETAQDTFDYTVTDSNGATDTATVTITITGVNDAPVATGEVYGTNEDTPLVVNAASGVLANDSDVENDALSAILVTDVSNGSLTLNPDGSFSYTPDLNFNGVDSFSYTANDGTVDGNTVTVTLNVAAQNDAPVATADVYGTNEDTPLVVNAASGVLANDSDIENDSLSAILASDVSNGSLTLNADGSFSYTPDANFNGVDGFTYKVNDGTVDGNTITVTLNVAAQNDAPLIADQAMSIRGAPLQWNRPGHARGLGRRCGRQPRLQHHRREHRRGVRDRSGDR